MPVCTWNPSDKAAAITLSGGNLVATGSGSVQSSVRATNSQTSGKFYFELKLTAVSGVSSLTGGLMTSAATLAGSRPGDTAVGAGIVGSSGGVLVNGITNAASPGITFALNDVMNFAVDLTAGKIWIAKNGTYPNSGNPATGANPWATFTPPLILFPACESFDNLNSFTANFGTTAFSTAAPAGFSPWTNTFYTTTFAQGSYAYTGEAMTFNSVRTRVFAMGSYAYNGFSMTFTLGSTRVLRAVKFVLQKLRVIQPTLGT